MAFKETGTPKQSFWGKLVMPHHAVEETEIGIKSQLGVSLVPDPEVAFKGG